MEIKLKEFENCVFGSNLNNFYSKEQIDGVLHSLENNSYIMLQEKNLSQIEFLKFVFEQQSESKKKKFIMSQPMYQDLLCSINYDLDAGHPHQTDFNKRFLPESIHEFLHKIKKKYGKNTSNFLESISEIDSNLVKKLNKLHHEYQV